MVAFSLAVSGLRFLLASKTIRSIHSPFVFDLAEKVLFPKNKEPVPALLNEIRNKLHQSKQTIQALDLGAGSGVLKTKTRKVRDMAGVFSKPPNRAALLFRLVQYLKPKMVVEMGTSMGLTTIHLAAGAPKSSKIFTLEGCPETSTLARETFRVSGFQNILLVEGPFDQTFRKLLETEGPPGFVFVDGNHAEKPTLEYFEIILKKSNPETVIVFDDIHWSPGMEMAWKKVVENPAVSVSIDLFDMGLVFLKNDIPKAHYTLRGEIIRGIL